MPRILIADDSEHGRMSLKALLRLRDGWTVCGEALNGRHAVLLAADLKPDVIILDFSMPMLDGLQAAKEILNVTPQVPIIMFTFHKTRQLDIEAERFGIRKVISKNDPLAVLLNVIQESLNGDHLSVGPLAIPADKSAIPPGPPAIEVVGPLAVPPPPVQPVEPLVAAPDKSVAPSAKASAAETPPKSPPEAET
jgi:DNA-binding NarL/FixJ family response regulator